MNQELLIDTVWRLDDGETFKFYEINHARTLRQMPKGTKLVPSIFALESESFKVVNGRNPLGEAKIAGKAREANKVRIVREGRKHPETWWVGFWDIKDKEIK